MGNRQRIIDAAVALMNENGSAVGTTQLIEHLSISPGNLYYHFRNREEIMVEVLSRLQSDLDAVLILEPGENLDAQRLARCFVGGADVLWQYRFFFSSSMELVMKDEQLSQQYREFCVRGTGQVLAILREAFRTAPGSQRLTASDQGKLAENMWILWTSWPRYTEVIKGSHMPEEDITRSYEHLAFLLKPYLSADFFKEVTLRATRMQKQFSCNAQVSA